ncbi:MULTISPECIES: shikimate dehydrogenase [unclassified Parafrankia]|uniref:shikimate dehydrogenase n=1 Tax=unclassified Parafrankia TaxID=2994368 RepID=UPI000DA51F82|nr:MULTISPECIES: shikimate dehydrogenase [unclassified Parafrankia]TCJ34815.1 shikimate dehydrogenase [Parafrankia sp. BMG5.11]CAI7977651.1 Shikimate dehydrogenase (NADP(+)) [Frankia sp. Hr75.2]SQD97868.1 Shikimate dehydrogenase [Parafrankia sp. Ea1.12]
MVISSRDRAEPAGPGPHAGRAAVLGSPIGHSLSPVLHTAAYERLGLDWTYTAIECDEAGLPGMLDRLRDEPGWAGVSLTMPLKTAAVDLLDDVEPTAALLGAVNTVVVREDGRLAGFNTDVDGVGYALRRLTGGAAPVQPLVLGAGGTARAVVAALARVGATRVAIVARRPDAVAELVGIGARLGVSVTALPWDILSGGMPAGPDLVVATTPAGVTDELARRPWPVTCALLELLYHPWPTALAACAYRGGARVVGGLEVLAGQAVGQVCHFTGRPVDERVLLAAGHAALSARVASRIG